MENIDQETTPLLAKRQNEQTNKKLFDPEGKLYRYFGLIFIASLTFGPYFCYVLPGALEKEIERDLKITTSQFTVFTSLYSWPNVILCFFGGYLIDKVLGIRLGAIIFSCLITCGQLLFGYGAYSNSVILMDVGRFVFGLGGECVAVAQKAYSIQWFKSSELNLVFGFLSSAALLGSSINQLTMAPIYDYVNTFETGYKCLGISILLASITCLFSTLCSFILLPLDKNRQNHLKNSINSQTEVPPSIKLTDAIHFPVQLWFIIAICVVFYSATFPFISLAKLYFIHKYNFSPGLASLQQSIFFFISVIASPIFGLIVDYTGYNILWVILSLVTGSIAHGLLMFTFINSFIPVILLGASLSLLAVSLWPMVSIIIPKHQLATAYGLMQSIQNLGLAVFSLLSGVLVENYGYYVLELFFLCLCLIGLLFAIILYFVDKLKNGKLCIAKKSKEESIN